MPRQRKRDTSPDTRYRNMHEVAGRQGIAGLSRVGGGGSHGFGGLPASIVQPQADVDTTGAAQLLCMSVSGASVAAGGGYVGFDTIVSQVGFDGIVQPQDGYWAHPIGGVYLLTYEHGWDSYTGGGTVRLEVDGVLIPGGIIASGDSGQEGRGVIAYVATEGSVGRVYVDHDSASAQTCSALVRVAITDPDAQATATASDWELVFAANVWGIVHDGTNWWTTEGNAGVTVFKRDATGGVVSSFEATQVAGSDDRARGITFDGSDLWVLGDDERVARYSTAGAHEVTLDLGPSWGSERTMSGLAHDGSDLWVVGRNTSQLRRYSTAGSLELTVGLAGGHIYQGLTVYGGQLYLADATDMVLMVFSLAGVWVDTIDISDAPAVPAGLWIAADGTIYIGATNDGVYRRLTVL